MLEQVAELARSARIPLGDVAPESETARAALPGLTPREREILAHVVAGRTYAEIAAALVLSEKTVSSTWSAASSVWLRPSSITGRPESR